MAPAKSAFAGLVLFALTISAAPTPTADEPATPVLDARQAQAPATFTANPNIGPGGGTYKDSAHFRVYGDSGSLADNTIKLLEGAYSCFVGSLGWRSSGLSYNDANDAGPWTKVNLYIVDTLPGAAGVMHSDYATGMAWLEVQRSYPTVPGVTVHEYGHGLTYHEKYWVDQGRTGAWWETLANWFADTFKTSPLCAAARSANGISTSASEVNLRKVIGDSFQVIVDGTAGSGNYYEAFPFLSYLTYNPDNYAGLGTYALRQMIRQYSRGSNETPLHALARISTGATAQQVVGRYWARMAYADIGHPTFASIFQSQKSGINFANYDLQSGNVYRVKSARRPRYMGANITPLKKSGAVTVTATISASALVTATLSVRNTSTGATRYVQLANNTGSTAVASNEEVSLVVANTPASLILFDPFALSGTAANTGLDYTVTLTGATP